ncbi:hypothetical protein DFA_09268 [Cavenderia fasciculata]|uniref:Uncharacterized protein n=1 Tax=Cavenderia fasciculata TaxID=261658 RepID=F4Q756_CACFS|nr:uncharacterized protein DFA_09268 [Cavenderia fasciculata]EGG16238.1 hypothetical protein DFA_09268 [Cavenderia fasciculata]|eukprot:XP_004354622.1 hypothetical protein DFA_09268 [Cavenderia fasciculata]
MVGKQKKNIPPITKELQEIHWDNKEIVKALTNLPLKDLYKMFPKVDPAVIKSKKTNSDLASARELFTKKRKSPSKSDEKECSSDDDDDSDDGDGNTYDDTYNQFLSSRIS